MTQLGEKCSQCGHTHQGPQFGYICIGCPCQELPREPHDAGLKRIETEEAKKQRRVAILEQIAETAFEISSLRNIGRIITTDPLAEFMHDDNFIAKIVRLKELKKELRNDCS